MKRLFSLPLASLPLATLLLVLPSLSCHKFVPTQTSLSITVVNAIPMTSPIIPVFGSGPVYYFATAQTIPYGSFFAYNPSGGKDPLYITKYPDTGIQLYAGTLPLKTYGIYSFFVAGDSTSPDTLLTADTNIPTIPLGDSTVGVRFVNLSSGIQPVNIDIQGDSTANLVAAGLAYRQAGNFQKLPATAGQQGNYVFEVRDPESDTLLLTYTWNFSLYRTQTLVLAGSTAPGSSTPLNIFAVKNY